MLNTYSDLGGGRWGIGEFATHGFPCNAETQSTLQEAPLLRHRLHHEVYAGETERNHRCRPVRPHMCQLSLRGRGAEMITRVERLCAVSA